MSGLDFHSPSVFMVVVTVVMFYLAVVLRKKRRIAVLIDGISWVLPPFYFVVEYIAIRATTSQYYFLKQPMSDLGVTTCRAYTYPTATHIICSPYHLLINWANVLTGIAIFVGAICFHPLWPTTRKTTIATVLLVIFGLSNTLVGVIPVDINFIWHVLVGLPGMVMQIPALFLIANSSPHHCRSFRPGHLSVRLSLSYLCYSFASNPLRVSRAGFCSAYPTLPFISGLLLQQLYFGTISVEGTLGTFWRHEIGTLYT